MKTYNMPETVLAFIFDMDGTLYTHHEYLQFQIDILIERLAKLRSVSFKEMQENISLYRKEYAEKNNGRQISLSTALNTFGISIPESIKWREELFEPSLFLNVDHKLKETLSKLSSYYKLAVVTNNPVLVARKTLIALSVENYFSVIVGLDTCMVSKPHSAPFLTVAKQCNVSEKNCVSVGDRYDIDIALPLELGMGGILVDGVEDVYELPAIAGLKI